MTRDPTIERMALTIDEFVRSIGISRRSFFVLQSRGEGPAVAKIGGRTLIRREAAEAWLKSREVPVESASSPPTLEDAKALRAALLAYDESDVDHSLIRKPLAEIDLGDPATLRALQVELRRAIEERRAELSETAPTVTERPDVSGTEAGG